MGEVFRARDHDLHRDVAVKFLPERFAADPVRLGRFAQEARAASSLNHPNIVTIHEIGETSGLPYIVMELVEGQTLRELVEGPLLPPRRVLGIAAQLADGLAKAHGAGITHRDLKPENVMVTADGYVKILDFGLAKLRSSSAGEIGPPFDSNAPTWPDPAESPLTVAGAVFGTVGYMSPEQARGREVDFRSDQFAFGAIVYEMASGRQAFHRETPPQTLAAIIESEPESLEGLNAALPPPARWIIERCLEKEPADRYASTMDLARELHTIRDRLAEAGSAPGVSGSGESPSPRPRRRGLTWGLAVAAGLVVLFFWPMRDCVRPSLPQRKQVAVLPFTSTGGGEEARAFSDGLVETLSTKLTQLERFQRALWVVPFSEVRAARVDSASEARQAFGVTLVVTGSVQWADEAIRLTANLVDAESLRQLRAAVIDAERGDPATLQDGLIRQVAEMLDVEISSEAGLALAAGESSVGSAWEHYVEGRGHLQRYDDPASVDAAISAFQAALQRDPDYALAYAGLGEAHWRRYLLTRDPASVDLAKKACDKALALNQLLAPVHVTLGIVRAGTGEAEAAVGDFERALALDPFNDEALQGMARAYERLGRPREAERAYLDAIERQGGDWGHHSHLGAFYWRRGRYEDAEREFRRALELAPHNTRALNNLAALLAVTDREDEAMEALRRSLQIRPTYAAASNLGTIEFGRGHFAEAARLFEQAAEIDDHDYRLWRNLGAARLWVPGQEEAAERALRRAASLAEEVLEVDPADADALAQLADSHAMLGEGDEARTSLEEALALAPGDVQVMELAAGVDEHLGDRDGALEWLGRAFEAGLSEQRVERNPWFEELRSDPRYRELVNRTEAASPAGDTARR
jgi:serine/threonine-protein kinase